VNALDQLVGDDDLVAVMTPEMSAADITFARKTRTIDGILTRYWNWGERGQLISVDPEEEQYRSCYPGVPNPGCDSGAGVAEELIERRREKRTLDALQSLVEFLRVWREERKAILVISDGWRLFTPNSALTRQIDCHAPAFPTVRIDPRTGKPTTADDNGVVTAASCDRDRLTLSQIDDDRAFRDLLNDANRSNASFYPIDPRGLATFDEPLVKLNPNGLPAPVVPPSVNAAALQARVDTLRRAAGGTDGLAVVSTNDLAAGLRRIVSDLSSYYLLGYYSTVKLDGKYHSITVRVKRPGVQVRARRGYLAATVADLAAASKSAAPAAAPAAATVTNGAAAAIADLVSSTRGGTLKAHVVAGWAPGTDDRPRPMFWVEGEVIDSTSDIQFEVAVSAVNGEPVATARARIPAGSRSALMTLVPTGTIATGQYSVRVRSQGNVESETSLTSVSLQLAPNASGAVLMRRGPTTGNRDVPTADLNFRRADQLRLDVPIVEVGTGTARLLDRTGQPLNLPVTTTLREDADGTRWTMARLALAPLAPGDYLVELSPQSGGPAPPTLVAFRVIP
jgi:VWFA-related protein